MSSLMTTEVMPLRPNMDEYLSGCVLKTTLGNVGVSSSLYLEKGVSWNELEAIAVTVDMYQVYIWHMDLSGRVLKTCVYLSLYIWKRKQVKGY